MTKRGTWLQAAVRAQQAQTFEHVQRAQQAREDLFAAERLNSQSAQALVSLVDSWTGRRREAYATAELDHAYCRFHGHLRGKAEAASQAQQEHQTHVEVAVMALQKSHAVQRTLEKVARQLVQRGRREAWEEQTRDAAEVWLLGQFANSRGKF